MLTALLATLFPLTCPGCARAGSPVCDDCATSLHDAAPAPAPHGVDAWWSAFAYDGVAREVVARAKYRGAHAVNAWLARCMASVLPPPLPAVVIPVPTSDRRRLERGFDHAALLGAEVARLLHRPMRRLLGRDDGPPQTGLAASARRLGPTIEARRASPPHVLLVDDVATTGTTISAAAIALRAVGARRIVALTAARTAPPPRQYL